MRALWHRYWFEHSVLSGRLTAFRVVFFGLLAFDAWLLNLGHAPRYGVEGFNVSQIGLLDPWLPVPTPAIITVMYLVSGFLALRAALGIAVRSSVWGTTILWSGAYFWSQADSYQHHYLIALVLVIACAIPWDSTASLDRPTPKDGAEHPPRADTRVKSWGMRLLYVEVAITYYFTAITKMDAHWVDGSTVESLTTGSALVALVRETSALTGLTVDSLFIVVVYGVIVGEVFAGAVFLWPRLHKIGFFVVPVFHILVEHLGVDIGWFSYYMIAIDVILLMPDSWFAAICRGFVSLMWPVEHLRRRLVGAVMTDCVSHLVVGIAVAVVCVVAAACVPLEGRAALLVSVALLSFGAHLPGLGRRFAPVARGGLQMGTAGVMAMAINASDVPYDYYRYWGGDLYRRGHLEAAAECYEKANRHKTEGPARYFKLGRVYEELGRWKDARRAYANGLAREPGNPGGYEGLLRVHERLGR